MQLHWGTFIGTPDLALNNFQSIYEDFQKL